MLDCINTDTQIIELFGQRQLVKFLQLSQDATMEGRGVRTPYLYYLDKISLSM